MQMFIAFKEDNGGQAKEVLTYISHCLNADIREGSIGKQKGWMFIFRDDLRPFTFGSKRKYTAEDENTVAEDIRKGKSLRKISQERRMAVTTVRALHKRYLERNPEAYPFLTKNPDSGSVSGQESGLEQEFGSSSEAPPPTPDKPRFKKDYATETSQPESEESLIETGATTTGRIDQKI